MCMVMSNPPENTRPSRSSRKIYFALVGGTETGPYSIRDLVQLRNNKTLKADTPVRIDGSSATQPLETLLTHKLGTRKLKRVARGSLQSFSRNTLPTIAFAGLGVIAVGMGIYTSLRGGSSFAFLGYGLTAVGFGLFVFAYFIHPKSEK